MAFSQVARSSSSTLPPPSEIAFCAPQNSQRRSVVPGANESRAPHETHGNVRMNATGSASVRA
jgi:hypothetical protein